jgi:hypothetical protein
MRRPGTQGDFSTERLKNLKIVPHRLGAALETPGLQIWKRSIARVVEKTGAPAAPSRRGTLERPFHLQRVEHEITSK